MLESKRGSREKQRGHRTICMPWTPDGVRASAASSVCSHPRVGSLCADHRQRRRMTRHPACSDSQPNALGLWRRLEAIETDGGLSTLPVVPAVALAQASAETHQPSVIRRATGSPRRNCRRRHGQCGEQSTDQPLGLWEARRDEQERSEELRRRAVSSNLKLPWTILQPKYDLSLANLTQ